MGVIQKKTCVADTIAHPVNAIFASNVSSSTEVYLGTLLFAIQIFCDFSGYTDIARGLSRLLGFELMLNFNIPYISKTPSEFWKRWHISLSSWLRDYLYIPLGGNQNGSLMTYRNLMLTMILGGLWHGASYNFILWGLFHGSLLSIHRAFTNKVKMNPKPSLLVDLIQTIFMFHLTLIGWLIFRVENMGQLKRMVVQFFSNTNMPGASYEILSYSIPLTLPLIAMTIYQIKSKKS